MDEKRTAWHVVAASLLGVGLTLGLLFVLSVSLLPVSAAHGAEAGRAAHAEEASGAVITVCRECGCDYAVIQDAVDAAQPGDEIRMAAGIYTDVNDYGGLAQVVYLDKSVTLRGGYSVGDWTTSDPPINPTTLDARGEGRVLYVTGDISPTIEGLRITGGDASGLGGGFDLAPDGGGGVYLNLTKATITGCEVLSNVADAGGGAYVYRSAAHVAGNVFAENAASYGGGLTLSGDEPRLEENAIEANTAEYGGGLYVRAGRAYVGDNLIRGNDADNGGGVCLKEDIATLAANVVSDNAATWCGGLYFYDSDTLVTGNTIASNAAQRGGGGVCAIQGLPQFAGNVIVGSGAGQHGGGLYLSQTDARLTNMVVADNGADGSGGGIYVWKGSPQLVHATLARNGGAEDAVGGSGLYVAAGSAALTNTILVGHQVGVFVEDDALVTLEGTLWGSGIWANGLDTDGEGTVDPGTNSYQGDPAFVDPDDGDYHIGSTSAALDRGVNAGVTSDLDGHPRPIGPGIDLGADESTGVDLSASSKSADPDQLEVGDVTTYSIRLVNSGHLTADDLVLFDAIPSHATYVSGSALATQGALGHGGAITWTGTLTPGRPLTVTFRVTATELGGFKNTALITDAYGTVTRLRAWVNASYLYMPLIVRSY